MTLKPAINTTGRSGQLIRCQMKETEGCAGYMAAFICVLWVEYV